MNRTIRLQRRVPQHRELWQAWFYRHPQQSRRRRRLALKALWDGQSMIAVCRTQGIQRKTQEKWLDSDLHGGFEALLAPPKRPRPQTLSSNRRKSLRYILLHKTPMDYGIDRYPWTAPCVQDLLGRTWGLTLSTNRLYESFDELSLSHQRAHRDYGPSKPAERAGLVRALEKKPPPPAPTSPS